MNKPDKPILVIVIPCYNEEEVFPETARCLSEKISQLVLKQLISPNSALVFVDDGSVDNTWGLIEKSHAEKPASLGGVKLLTNCGHQQALLCGLYSVKDYADITVSIDADLQDDVEAIDQMVAGYAAGCDIVLGVRAAREVDSFFKRTSARLFYRFMRFMGADLVENHADFRLMSREALNSLFEYKGPKSFLRGIVPLLGCKTGTVYYDRKMRSAGKSKYTLRKMLKFAFTGIVSARIKHTSNEESPESHIEKILLKTVNGYSC
ncbi:MAG: glycosyltransferase family 2 protein [Treponema sp.]|nr:glycosyltransferase family 2 protein [Treponema sp.]